MRELRSQGITLLELVIVVSILGVVAVVAIPGFHSVEPQKLELAAEEFAEAIRFARSEAVRTGNLYGFFVEPANKRIRVFRADTGTNPPTPIYDVYHPVSRKRFDIDLDSDIYADADTVTGTPVYQGTCSSPGLIVFNATGVPYCGDPVTVPLRQGDVSLLLGGLTRVVSLQGITGRVTVQ